MKNVKSHADAKVSSEIPEKNLISGSYRSFPERFSSRNAPTERAYGVKEVKRYDK